MRIDITDLKAAEDFVDNITGDNLLKNPPEVRFVKDNEKLYIEITFEGEEK